MVTTVLWREHEYFGRRKPTSVGYGGRFICKKGNAFAHLFLLLAFVNMSTTRRLAAATGHPYGIDDAFIVLEYPTDQPGFSSTQPIRTNARIARVTSRILIGNGSISTRCFRLTENH